MDNPSQIYGRKWSEKEYLIVLHQYFLHKNEPQHADTLFVQEIADLIGRTPHSILYRLQNFSSIDPDENNLNKKGKANITDFGRRIFSEWSLKKEVLKETAEAFIRDEKEQNQPDLFTPNPQKLPVTFKNYELLDQIGRGGFGVVCSCINTKTDAIRAIKVIDSENIYNQDSLGRFAREIKALKSIDHPNIIKIYEDNLDKQRDYPGFIMDLAEIDLFGYINSIAKEHESNSRPILNKGESTHIALSMFSAVEALHHSNPPIIHRDINPTNILKTFDKSWVLADFSLAKFLPPEHMGTTFATKTHIAGMGTQHYTPPEQYISLKLADQSSDIFSLGWLIWDLFSEDGPYPRREPSGLPEKLERIFLKATSHDKKDRYQDISELKSDFLIALV
jgi:serine/threonine protein kinase